MKIRTWPFALGFLLAGGGAFAQDVDESEDPFVEEDRDENRWDDEGEEHIDSGRRSFGRAGDLSFVVERLFGVARTWRRIELVGPDDKSKVDRMHLLLNATGDPIGYSAARIGIDVFVSDGLSLGAALGYSSDLGPVDHAQFTFAPRIGYAIMFGQVVGLWVRGGAVYQHHAMDDRQVAVLAGSLEAPLIFVPAKNVLIAVGPTLELSIVGKVDPEDAPKQNIGVHELGFSAGFGVSF